MSLVLSPVEGLQYWFMLPIAVLIATIAMESGVGGATFFAPLFILAAGPRAATCRPIGCCHSRRVWWWQRRNLLDHSFTIPGVILGGHLGSWVISRFPQRALERGLHILLLLFAALTLVEAVL